MASWDTNVPGTSLFDIANGATPDRNIISEYHDGGVSTGLFMLLHGPWKYIYYPGHRPQLFDTVNDPSEDTDLAEGVEHDEVLTECEAAMRAVFDPDEINALALTNQAKIIENLGGYDAINNMEEANIFIEVEALYVNSDELRQQFDLLVK